MASTPRQIITRNSILLTSVYSACPKGIKIEQNKPNMKTNHAYYLGLGLTSTKFSHASHKQRNRALTWGMTCWIYFRWTEHRNHRSSLDIIATTRTFILFIAVVDWISVISVGELYKVKSESPKRSTAHIFLWATSVHEQGNYHP